MRIEGLIELRRHFRAIDIALKKEIEHMSKKLKAACGHPACETLKNCKYQDGCDSVGQTNVK